MARYLDQIREHLGEHALVAWDAALLNLSPEIAAYLDDEFAVLTSTLTPHGAPCVVSHGHLIAAWTAGGWLLRPAHVLMSWFYAELKVDWNREHGYAMLYRVVHSREVTVEPDVGGSWPEYCKDPHP